MGEPAAKQPGTRSDRGECEAGEVDQRQHAEKRPAGCANPGAAGAVRSGVAAADPASQREGARGPDASAGEGGAGGYAYRVGEHSAWHGQSDGRAIAGLRCRPDGSGENARAAGNAGGGTEATTGNSGSVDQTDQSQRSEAGAAGRKRLSGNRIAAPGEWSRKFDLADFRVDGGRSEPIPEEPGCGELRGTAAAAEGIGREPAAVGNQQGRRCIFAQAFGARSALHSQPQESGHGSKTVGPETGREGQQECEEASTGGGGAEAGNLAAPFMGKRRSIRTVAE